MEVEQNFMSAKLELSNIASNLVVKYKPDFDLITSHTSIKTLALNKEVGGIGKQAVLKSVFVLLKDFCGSVNVVRNMNESQMIDAAAMILDEVDDFRMEDLVAMFSMAKRGQLFEIRDRIDLQIISKILDVYYIMRQEWIYNKQIEESDRYKRQLGEQSAGDLSDGEIDVSKRLLEFVVDAFKPKKMNYSQSPEDLERAQKEFEKQREKAIKEYAEKNGIDVEMVKREINHPTITKHS